MVDFKPPSRVPPLPHDPTEAGMVRTYQRLREIPAQHNLLPNRVVLTTRAGLVLHVMNDPIIMEILKEEMDERHSPGER